MPWYETAETIKRFHTNPQCTCCDKPLTSHAIRMLELDQRTQTYHDLGNVPENKSQGWFPFGLRCAKRKLNEHHDAQYAMKNVL